MLDVQRPPSLLRIRSEEDRRTKHALEGRDQAPVLRSALLHAKDIQHFSSAAERDGLFLLPHCECREKNGNQPILSPRNAVVRVSYDLQNELAIPTFVHQRPSSRPLDRESTHNEWSRGEPQIRVAALAVDADELNGFRLPVLPF